jgi:RND family efflux transporter MFP subunit
VQVITAKTNVESLENQLNASEENVKVAVEQLNTTSIYSDVNGIANVVAVKVGEMFQPGQIVIVNTSTLKAVADIPENYLGRVQKGTPVEVLLPDLGKSFTSYISLISQTINASSRGFTSECKIPAGYGAKPNQAAIMKIKDYSNPSAIVIPVNMVQTDESGKYVYVMLQSSNGKNTAHKIPVMVGDVYGDNVEIMSGLRGGENLITEGYQSLYEGQVIASAIK